MAQAASLELVQGKVTSMNTVLDQVHSTSLKIDNNVSEIKNELHNSTDVTKNEMKLMRKNSDDSLDMFKAMMISLKNIELSNSKTSPTITPTVDSSNNPQSSEVNQVPVRKGIMFTSSIALETDTKRYMDELNMDLKVIPTHYIHENTSAQDSKETQAMQDI